MRRSLSELDGVFTYICVTEDALGVAKDELGAKPLVLYESDDIVALASEEIAIRKVVDREIETYDPYEGAVMVWTDLSDDLRRPRARRARRHDPEDLRDRRRARRARRARAVHAQDQRRAALAALRAGHQGRDGPQPGRAPLARRRDPDPLPRSPSRAASATSAVGLIDGAEIQINGRVGWSVAENMMSGVVVIESNAGSLAGAALRGGDLVVKGQVGARTGIDQKGGTILVLGDAGLDDRLHDAARPPDHLRRRGPRPRRLDVRRHDLRGRQGRVARASTASRASGPTPTPS